MSYLQKDKMYSLLTRFIASFPLWFSYEEQEWYNWDWELEM